MKLTLESYKAANGALNIAKMSEIVRLNQARTFIETGTYLGDTVSFMREIFDKVYSIELSEDLYGRAIERFAGDEKITLLMGDSSEKLHDAIALSADPSPIFWLDAHWSGGNTARSIENTPIVKELQAIQTHRLNNSIVMIDDLRYFINIPQGFEVHDANYGYPLLHQLLDHVGKLWPTHVPLVNGDVLFIFPRQIYADLNISDVLRATHMMRAGGGGGDQESYRALESTIALAEGNERETIMTLPETFKHSLGYGIGGEYLYWRGLVHEHDHEYELARADYLLARKCGIHIPARIWE